MGPSTLRSPELRRSASPHSGSPASTPAPAATTTAVAAAATAASAAAAAATAASPGSALLAVDAAGSAASSPAAEPAVVPAEQVRCAGLGTLAGSMRCPQRVASKICVACCYTPHTSLGAQQHPYPHTQALHYTAGRRGAPRGVARRTVTAARARHRGSRCEDTHAARSRRRTRPARRD
jgi:hypothetical protein